MPKKAAVALLKAGVKKMGSNDRKNIELEYAQIKSDLEGREGEGTESSRPDLLQDKFRLVARKKQIEDILNKDDDLKAQNGGDRDRIQSRINDLEGKIHNGQLSAREEAVMPRNSQEFEMAVKKQIAHQKAHLGNIQEWQQLKRRQEPENPMADDVALLLDTKTTH